MGVEAAWLPEAKFGISTQSVRVAFMRLVRVDSRRPAVPDRFDKLVLGHDPAAVGDEKGEQVEDRRLDGARKSAFTSSRRSVSSA
jgi:hypothetical protein